MAKGKTQQKKEEARPTSGMKAILRNYRQSPRKVRLVANLVRGKSVSRALTALSFLNKKASGPIQKLIESAAHNAEVSGAQRDSLIIKEIRVDAGLTFMRHRARARGRAAPIAKRTSHVLLELGPSTSKN